MDYSTLSEITVKTQAELDAIPLDFKGRIYIDGGKPYNRIIVRNKYYYCVVACDNSSVEARGNSSVEAWDNSSVVARENSSVVARGNSSVEAWDNSSVVACDNSSVVAWDNSSVVACDNSSVVARENSSIVANANAQIVDRSCGHKIKISGNARIVYMPKSIIEFCDFYGIKHTKTKATFYKAVRKDGDMYFSDYDSDFIYEVGKTKSEKCDDNKSENCGQGIHIAHLNWALNYGVGWDNLAILEVETKLTDIVLSNNSDGKVRTSQVKVLREVPLEECGVYGKIIEKRRVNKC